MQTADRYLPQHARTMRVARLMEVDIPFLYDVQLLNTLGHRLVLSGLESKRVSNPVLYGWG